MLYLHQNQQDDAAERLKNRNNMSGSTENWSTHGQTYFPNVFFGILRTSVAFTFVYCRHNLLLQSKTPELQFKFDVKYNEVYT
jgi:hypothetical protein